MKKKFTVVEFVLLAVCLALMMLALWFWGTKGLMDENGQYTHTYMSTGSDDDGCISIGILWFGSVLFTLPWFRGRVVAVWLKVVGFLIAWLLQLLSLHWIEVGSVSATIVKDNNLVSLVFLAIFIASLPAVVSSLIYWIGWRRNQNC